MADKKELAVAALRNGTVIDHIPSNMLFKAVKLLDLEKVASQLTIGNNLASKRETQKPSLGVGTWFSLIFNKVFERKEKLRWGCSLVETGVDLSDRELVSLSLGCLPLQTRYEAKKRGGLS